MRVLITGATGCVGRYFVEEMLANTAHELVLVVRDRARLAVPDDALDRVTVVEADMRDLDACAAAAEGVDTAVLIATSWGGEDTYAVTVDANLALADRLIAAGCGHILYFATASVLAQDGALLPAAERHGTDYIRAKYLLVEGMEKRAEQARITGLFPTLVFGGRREAPAIPFSHFANLLTELWRYVWALRFVSADARFHVVHAADISTVVRHLIDTPPWDAPARLVLGNPASSVDEMMAELVEQKGKRLRTLYRLKPAHVDFLVRVLPITLSPWDRFCVDHPDQSHPGAVNPASYGLPVAMPRLRDGLASIGLGRAG